MSKCSQCRKQPVQDSIWDRIRLFFFSFFRNDIVDLSQDKFTQGFGDGYQKGFEHGVQAEKSRSKVEIGTLNSEDMVIDTSKVWPKHDATS